MSTCRKRHRNMRNMFSQHAIFCPKQQIARTPRFPKTSLLCNNFQDVFYNIAGYPSACLTGLFYKCRTKIARPQLHTRAYSLPQLVKFKIKPVSAISHVSAPSPQTAPLAFANRPSVSRIRALCPPVKTPSGSAAFFLYATTAPPKPPSTQVLAFLCPL